MNNCDIVVNRRRRGRARGDADPVRAGPVGDLRRSAQPDQWPRLDRQRDLRRAVRPRLRLAAFGRHQSVAADRGRSRLHRHRTKAGMAKPRRGRLTGRGRGRRLRPRCRGVRLSIPRCRRYYFFTASGSFDLKKIPPMSGARAISEHAVHDEIAQADAIQIDVLGAHELEAAALEESIGGEARFGGKPLGAEGAGARLHLAQQP